MMLQEFCVEMVVKNGANEPVKTNICEVIRKNEEK